MFKKILSLAALLGVALLPGISAATVTGTTTSATFTCAASTGPYAFTFPAFDLSGIAVIETTNVGVQTILPTTAYTGTPVNNSYMNGGSVTLGTACPIGDTLTIQRTTEQTQLSAFTEYMPALYQTFESGLDKLTMEVQDIAPSSLKLTAGSPYSNLTVPDPIAGDMLMWKTDLTGLYNVNPLTITGTLPATYSALLPSYTYATLPAVDPVHPGRLVRVTDNIRGIWKDTGTTWVSLTGWADVSDFGFSTTATAAANTAAVRAAVAGLGYDAVLGRGKGGTIHFPPGTFPVAPGIGPYDGTHYHTNVVFEGSSSGYDYTGASEQATHLVFTSGTYGFDLTGNNGLGTDVDYTTIKDLFIDGAGVLNDGIAFIGVQIIEQVLVTATTNAGIECLNYFNSTHLDKVALVGNTGWGLKLMGATGGNTTGSIRRTNIRSNTLGGVRIENGVNIATEDSVIESNTGPGLSIYAWNAYQIAGLQFRNVWFENNNNTGAGSYQVVLDAQSYSSTTGAIDTLFEYCNFNSTGSTRGVHILAAYFAEFRHTNALGGDSATSAYDLETGANMVTFWNLVNYGPSAASLANGNRSWQASVEPSLSGGGLRLTSPLYASSIVVPGVKIGVQVTTTGLVSGAATTVFSIPSSTRVSYYQIFVRLESGTSDATSYSAYALIAADSTTKVIESVNGTKLSLSLSGLNVQVTQASGSPANVTTVINQLDTPL